MRNAPPPSEAQLYATVTEYLALALRPGVIFHHSPNEGKRGWKAQGDLKKTASAGVGRISKLSPMAKRFLSN